MHYANNQSKLIFQQPSYKGKVRNLPWTEEKPRARRGARRTMLRSQLRKRRTGKARLA